MSYRNCLSLLTGTSKSKIHVHKTQYNALTYRYLSDPLRTVQKASFSFQISRHVTASHHTPDKFGIFKGNAVLSAKVPLFPSYIGRCSDFYRSINVLKPTEGSKQPAKYMTSRTDYTYFGGRRRAPWYENRTTWILLIIIVSGIGLYYVFHLDTVPISGRVRMLDVSPQVEIAMGEEAYKQMLAQYRGQILPPSHKHVKAVRKVGMRIIEASQMENLKKLRWEFTVIDSEVPNAFVLPGGKVCVFTGILPVMQNEDGMAGVLAHEIAHVIARHSAERSSFTRILFIGARLIQALTGFPDLVLILLPFVTELPFSRACETEADHIGLLLMSKACYDPTEFKKLWLRMENLETKAIQLKIPTFLSTHPSNKKRAEKIDNWMPEAVKELEKSRCPISVIGGKKEIQKPRIVEPAIQGAIDAYEAAHGHRIPVVVIPVAGEGDYEDEDDYEEFYDDDY